MREIRFHSRAVSWTSACLILAGVIIVFCPGRLRPEDLTLTAYYPSPLGVYSEILTTSRAVLARDSGNVGIGTPAPLAKLHVHIGTSTTVENIVIFSNDNGGQVFRIRPNGLMYVRQFKTEAEDVAEMYPSSGDLEPGDVVVIENRGGGDKSGKFRAVKSRISYAPNLLGVVSTKPGSTLGWDIEKNDMPGFKPIALAGKVPVRVTLENGPVKIGDYLTSSSSPGCAMRATEPGPAIGIALETFEGDQEKILCFVGLGERNLASRLEEQASELQNLKEQISELRELLAGRK